MVKVKKFLYALIVSAIVMSAPVSALAAESSPDPSDQTPITAEDNRGVMPLDTHTFWIGNGYGTIAENPNGINGDIYITMTSTPSIPNEYGYNGFNRGVDIIMYDKNGTIVWRGDNVFGIQNHGSLWCGANVTRVDMRIAAKIGVNGDNYEVKVTY